MIGLRPGRRTHYAGTSYRSEFEADVARGLDSNGVEFAYESENYLYSTAHNYTPDFVLPGGVVVEAKGYFDAQDRRTLLEVRKQHPAMDLRILFQKADRRLTPKRRAKKSMTYGEWATKHGFIWAEGPNIPKEWILE